MAWSVQRHSELGLIEIVYTGQTASHDVTAATAEALRLADADRLNLFLTELTDVDLKISPGDVYALPSQWESLHANRQNKSAICVTDRESMRLVQFHVNTSRNRGWQVEAFTDRQVAIDWLTG